MRRRPIPGLRHAIFPYWPGWRLPEPEPAISFLPGVGGQESFTCGGAVAFLVPACRPTPRFYPLTFTLFGITRIALKWTAPLIGCTTHPNVGLKDETGFQRMAASPGTELMSPASPPTTSQPSHLKAYPYLFVRETDQVCKLKTMFQDHDPTLSPD